MAKIIEFTGAPGVGKSTIFKEVEKRWKSSYNWIPAEKLLPYENLFSGDTNAIFINILKKLKNGKGGLDKRKMKAAYQNFSQQYPEFIDACWQNIACLKNNEIHNADNRLARVAYFQKIIQKVQIVKLNTTYNVSLLDEGLIHMMRMALPVLGNTAIDESEQVLKILNIIPLPDALVYFDLDANENAKRLLSREKTLFKHKGLTMEELERVALDESQKRAFVVTALENRGIPVLRINTANRLSDNVETILSFLNKV